MKGLYQFVEIEAIIRKNVLDEKLAKSFRYRQIALGIYATFSLKFVIILDNNLEFLNAYSNINFRQWRYRKIAEQKYFGGAKNSYIEDESRNKYKQICNKICNNLKISDIK